ncbi:ectonucleotide pyrophosphatase/phosphodiesterase [Solilutibacter silvestris]|uniref:Type I phosphodiesterase / nucleotide pyrophosphatase n=1 Tax=Solilutibacter silvestris TaxID=1645665 RepID=A0A2K1Q3J7_9GAMM|nr:ectonucleotide pyrophosphatase/phosphodiesterase [Lysobacter silvestris]PNS09620.1 Type I phosphodiesterase / nucleotide pyrophosphatase [Lysobacter silvestris]
MHSQVRLSNSLRFLLLAILLLAGCATTTAPPSPRPPVLLISVDGLRARDVTPTLMPNVSRLAAQGVLASDGMRPSFPSLTFPNHYTIVTGLRPDHHGIVQNTMRDPQLGSFKLSNESAVGDGRWWGGEPVWVSVEKAGLHSATLFWPGSQAAIAGVRPTRWQKYDKSVTTNARVDIVSAWLGEPEVTRPAFITLYFDEVDETEHEHGPGSPEANAALHDTDAAIGRLFDALRTRGQLDAVNIVLVSDHGFANVPRDHVVAVEDVVTKQEAEAVSLGQVPEFAPNPGFEAIAERKLLGRHDHFECWKKAALPPRWHYGSNPRIPPIVCQMDEGWDMLAKSAVAKRLEGGDRGSHGYDPALPSMRATFVAHGPAFVAGAQLPVFDNVDVYPLLMRLLGLAPRPNDGDPRTFNDVLTSRGK